uniref:WW domain-containing protein n=1 Tax=Bionectria ochroleuca TaxID=29856 RepID=A0A8H7NDV8_BIOOC
MAGPTSPSADGPTFAPPQLPAGWIAQWDGASKKYYYVQLSTGVSQWEIPTQAVQTGNTPAQQTEHPYGTPQPEVITHPDGSQTIRHSDGTMEPILPPGLNAPGNGPTGDRGLGSMAMNALMGGGKNSGGSHGSSSNPLGGLASSFLSGGHSNSGSHGNNQSGHSSSPLSGIASSLLGGGSNSSGHNSGGKNSGAGKLVGQLASSLLSSNSNKPQQPQNYHGSQSSGQSSQHHGLAGAMMGGVANLMGGKPHGSSNQNFGYSNSGTSSGYSGQAPTYQPPGGAPPSSSSGQSYQSPAPNQQQSGGNHNQYAPPTGAPPQGYYTPPTSRHMVLLKASHPMVDILTAPNRPRVALVRLTLKDSKTMEHLNMRLPKEGPPIRSSSWWLWQCLPRWPARPGKLWRATSIRSATLTGIRRSSLLKRSA